MRRIVLLVVLLAAATATMGSRAAELRAAAGRPVAEVLREASAAGLRIVFSEALVPGDLRVLAEPSATELVARLREILAPHALALEELQPGAFVVVRRAQPARPEAPAADEPLEEVRVLSSRYTIEAPRADQALSLGAVELERQPALLEDATRSIRRFPGTAGTGFSSRTFVRGGLSEENLLLLDGVPLQKPFHLPGLPADLSLLDPVTLERIHFYSGVLPVEYGDRMSSVIDMRTRSGADRFGGRLSAGTLNVSALLAGPLPAGSGDWLAFLRRGVLDQVARLVEPELGEPLIVDALGRVRYRLGRDAMLTLGALLADSDVDLAVRDGAETSRSESDRSYIWGALDWQRDATYVRTLLAHTSAGVDRAGALREPAGSTGDVLDRRDTETTLLRQDWRHTLASDWALRWGASARRDHTDYDYSRSVEFVPEVAALFDQPPSSDLMRETAVTLREYEAYVGASRNLGARWSVEGGVHWNDARYSTGQDSSAWDPRVVLLYRLSPATRFRLAWGRMTQTWTSDELPVELDLAAFESASRSLNRVLGWEHDFQSGLALRVEAFDKEISDPRARRENLLDSITLVPELRPDAIVIVPQRARVTGADVHASGPLGRHFSGWLSYSWSHARDLIDGREMPRSWDQRHALAMGLSRDYRGWNLSGVFTARSDWPVTPILPAPGPLGIEIGDPYSERDRIYHTLDLRAERRIPVARGELRLILELQNATNRQNHCCTELRFERNADGALVAREVRQNWLPIVPQASVAWEF